MFSDCFLVCTPKQHISKTQNLLLGSKLFLLPSRLLIHATLLATLAQNVSSSMFPRLRRPLSSIRDFERESENKYQNEAIGIVSGLRHCLKTK